MNKDYISVEDYAKHVKGVSKSYVHRLVREGKLDHIKREGKTLILTDMTPELLEKLGRTPEPEPVEAEVHEEFTEEEPEISGSESSSQEGSLVHKINELEDNLANKLDNQTKTVMSLAKQEQFLRATELKIQEIESKYSKELELERDRYKSLDSRYEEAIKDRNQHLEEVSKGRKSVTKWAVSFIATVIAFAALTYWILIDHTEKVEAVRKDNQTKIEEVEIDLNYRIDQNQANHEKEVQYLKSEKERELSEQKELYQATIKSSDERWTTQMAQIISVSANQNSELRSELSELRSKQSKDQEKMNALEVQLRLSLEKVSELKESIKAKEATPEPILLEVFEPAQTTANTQNEPLFKEKEVQELKK